MNSNEKNGVLIYSEQNPGVGPGPGTVRGGRLQPGTKRRVKCGVSDLPP